MQISDDNHLTLNCSIRFIVSSPEDAKLLKMQFPQYNIQNRKYFKDKTKHVITVELEDGLDLQPLEKYVHDYSGRLNHDFFISVSTESDSEIVEVPSYVVECIRNIGGKVNFSFTCI